MPYDYYKEYRGDLPIRIDLGSQTGKLDLNMDGGYGHMRGKPQPAHEGSQSEAPGKEPE